MARAGEVDDAGVAGEPGVEERVPRGGGDARVEEGGESELLTQGTHKARVGRSVNSDVV